jgi:hypothetical protein
LGGVVARPAARLLGTYREAPDRRAIPYGLAEFDGDRHQTVKGMTMTPFVPVRTGAPEIDARDMRDAPA